MVDATHPLSKHGDVLNAWIGFFKMIAVAIGIFYAVTDCMDCQQAININDVEVHLASLLVFPAAWLVYKHERYVSQTRPQSKFFGWLDFIGSIIGTAVITIAAVSWAPPVAALMTRYGVPRADFTELSFVTVVIFLPAAWYDLVVNQIWASSDESTNVAPQGFDVTKLSIAFQPDSINLIGETCGQAVAAQLKPLLEKIAAQLSKP